MAVYKDPKFLFSLDPKIFFICNHIWWKIFAWRGFWLERCLRRVRWRHGMTLWMNGGLCLERNPWPPHRRLLAPVELSGSLPTVDSTNSTQLNSNQLRFSQCFHSSGPHTRQSVQRPNVAIGAPAHATNLAATRQFLAPQSTALSRFVCQASTWLLSDLLLSSISA